MSPWNFEVMELYRNCFIVSKYWQEWYNILLVLITLCHLVPSSQVWIFASPRMKALHLTQSCLCDQFFNFNSCIFRFRQLPCFDSSPLSYFILLSSDISGLHFAGIFEDDFIEERRQGLEAFINKYAGFCHYITLFYFQSSISIVILQRQTAS